MNVDNYETLPTEKILVNMVAGALAGILEFCLMYPIDSVKTRMQSLAPSAVQEGIISTFLRMVRTEGVFRPVKGLSVTVAGSGPAHAVYFAGYEFTKDKLMHFNPNSNKYETIIYGFAGCVATIFHDGVNNPADVVKQRLQMADSPYRNAIHCIVEVYQREGLRAFYRSYTTQVAMSIPFQSIHFIVYEFAQKLMNKEHEYNAMSHLISGGLAGGVASAVTTPLDVCKTLLNTQQVGDANTLFDAVKTVYRLGGVTGFFRGLVARVIFHIPSTAICWSTYELFKYLLKIKRKKID